MVGLIRSGKVYAVHNNPLGRAQSITDPAKTVVWRATLYSHQRNVSLDDIGGYALDFPGQYVDGESGLNYNWHRFYDPTTGRYVQTDPVGLAGGVNTYSYAFSNPISNVDPTGLECTCSKTPAEDFVDSYVDNRNTTKDALSSWGGKAASFGLGIAIGKSNAVANATGGITAMQALKSVPSGGVALYGGLGGTAYAAAGNIAIGSAITFVGMEAGVSIGSLAVATGNALANSLSCQ